jgi:hypothetical protein
MGFGSLVIARLDPAIHRNKDFCKMMDARVEPAHDGRVCRPIDT